MSAFPMTLLAPGTANTTSDAAAPDGPARVYARDAKAGVPTMRQFGFRASLDLEIVASNVFYASLDLLRHSQSPWLALQTTLEEVRTLMPGWDGYGAPVPNLLSIQATRAIITRAFERGVTASAILPSAEGGVFVAFDGAGNRRANIECFNDGTAYAATVVGDAVSVWPVSTIDQTSLDSALQRISEHIATP